MMTINNYYDIYISDVKKLARTITIKSVATANAFNQYLIDYYGADTVDLNDPVTWKYYLNISGNYHPHNTLMYVTSMDTLEEILFSKENLAIHTTTAQYYQYGKNKYRDLVTQYPDQELLIKGILYPADLQTAINATDGTILSYPTELVEENEFTFIQNLQTWINGFKTFWTNNAYGVSNSLYHAANHAVLYANLIPVILNLRLKACKTNEVHSFHRRMYLASHGYLDKYIDYMTLEQSLFLYRNILYINKNAGKQKTFDLLTKEILTKRNIPIAQYRMKHNTSLLPDKLVPVVGYRKRDINIPISADNYVDISTEQLLIKEDNSARYNAVNRPHYLKVAQEEMENSLSSTVQTKVIESEMVDETDSTPYPFADALINNWIYLAGKNLYNTYITFDNPKTGELIEITAKEAFVFAFYCLLKKTNYELTNIPLFRYNRAQSVPSPSISDLLNIVDTRYVSQSTLTTLLSKQPIIRNSIFTTTAFYNHCLDIANAETYHRILIANTEDGLARGMIDNAVSRMYCDGYIDLSEGYTTYSSWFLAKKINIQSFTSDDYGVLYEKITALATGANFHTKLRLADIQNAMISIMRQLSSYTVQYISNININNIITFDFASQRTSNIGSVFNIQGDPVIVETTTLDDAVNNSDLFLSNPDTSPIINFTVVSSDLSSDIDVGVLVLSLVNVDYGNHFVSNSLNEEVIDDIDNTLTTNQVLLAQIGNWAIKNQ